MEALTADYAQKILIAIGKGIREARIVRKLTQKELSERADISRKTLVNIESGKPVSSLILAKVTWALSLDDSLVSAYSSDNDKIGRSMAFGSLSQRIRHKKPKNEIEAEFS